MVEPCANCPNPGAVLIDDPGANPVVYCDTCLPQNLRARVAAGQFGPAPEIDE